jgi:hypothetical protein
MTKGALIMSHTEPPNFPSDEVQSGRHENEWNQIREALKGLRFGTVNIIIQDGVIIQIDRTEKRRLARKNSSSDACR